LGLEYPAVRFLERNGYDVSYTTDVDVSSFPEELLRHRLIVIAGHSEYWTKEMRDGMETAVASGTNVALLGANTAYWQVRYEDDGRTVVAYKESATLDPETEHTLTTTRFRDLDPSRPECALFGVQYAPGSWGLDSQDFTVTNAAADLGWLADTGLNAGSVLGGLVGGEWDGVVENCTPSDGVVLLHWDGGSVGKPSADALLYVAPSGARVFSAGSNHFSWGLDDLGHSTPPLATAAIEQFMRNALNDLLRPAPPVGVLVSTHSGRATIRVTRRLDPRVQEVAIFRTEGATAPASLDERHAVLVCRTTTAYCTVELPSRRSNSRFAVVLVDQWTVSRPMFSRPGRFG